MKKLLLTFALALTLMPALARKIDYQTPLRQGISYTGRVQHLQNGDVKFNWVGVYLQTDFTGGAIGMEAKCKGTGYFKVIIDDKPQRVIKVSGDKFTRFELANNLSRSVHRLRLVKISEGSYGTATIRAFYLAKGGTLTPVAPKKRFIEVFGDSFTCGYGTEASGPREHFKLETEDFDHAYTSILARYFDADYAVEAHSGLGLVRNYNDSKQLSRFTMGDRFTYLFDDTVSVPYKFDAYKPDLVIIQLGTNDFSRIVAPTPNQYAGRYQKMIRTLRKHYGNIPILCSLPFSATPYLQTAFETLRQRMAYDKNTHIGEPMLQIMKSPMDFGADWHPSRQGQQKIAMKMIPQISAITGWKLEEKVIK